MFQKMLWKNRNNAEDHVFPKIKKERLSLLNMEDMPLMKIYCMCVKYDKKYLNGIKTHDRLNHCKSPVLMFVCALKAFM
jgi:hypothetical protein